tara:strand:- start:743 stop:1414 length:672 start_codon:yes stop_codon:yes gene_type:complete
MQQLISKKLFIYFFLFIFLVTINNKNLSKLNFYRINDINVFGLNEEENLKIFNNLKFLQNNNIFFINKKKISDLMNSNNLIERYSIIKKYPSTIELRVTETNYLASVNKEGKKFFFGSNGKLIDAKYDKKEIPIIYGNFKNSEFLELKKILDIFKFDFENINNFFYFPSGRWDIEMKSGILIKLPRERLKESIELSLDILKSEKSDNLKILDLRQKNLIIINE